MEPVLMTLPHPRSTIPGSAALVAWKVEFRQTSMTASHLHSQGNPVTCLEVWQVSHSGPGFLEVLSNDTRMNHQLQAQPHDTSLDLVFGVVFRSNTHNTNEAGRYLNPI